MSTHSRRPRYRRHRNHSTNFRAFLAAMATKWYGQESTINVSTVGSNVLALASAPDADGPYSLRGAVPPELRDLARVWLAADVGNNATIYTSRADLSASRGAVGIGSWDLSPDFLSLTALAPALNTLDTAGTSPVLTTLGTCASLSTIGTSATLGTPVAVTAVDFGAANTLTMVAHGYLVDDGPFYVASTGAIPAGLAATTPYWIQGKTVDTVSLAATLGGAQIDITDAGTGDITFVPVNVDLSLETITVVAHGLISGDGPVRVATDDALPTGLSADTDYWAIRITDDRLALATTKALALTPTPINLTAIGSGTTTLKAANVDVGLDSLMIAAHGLTTGDGPFYVSTGTTLPAGLAATTYYWARVLTADRFALSTTKANALDGVVVDLTDIGVGTQTVSIVGVDTTLEELTVTAHGLATGQLVRLTTNGTLPTGLTTATNYWAIAIDADHLAFAASLADSSTATKINLTAVGSGTTTVSKCNIDTTLDEYVFDTAHGLVTGDGPLRATSGTTLPTGISGSTDYYAVVVSPTVLKLATTEAYALAGTPVVDITVIGAGTQTLTLSAVDLVEDGIYIASHGMQTGDGPVRVSTNGILPTGLAAATDYWIISLDAHHISLATSAANALIGTDVNLTGIGSGTHQLVRALTIGKDLTADGILEWLSGGVPLNRVQFGSTVDVETVFI